MRKIMTKKYNVHDKRIKYLTHPKFIQVLVDI